MAASAQVGLPSSPEGGAANTAETGGRFSSELLRARADRPSIPLRYGNVRSGSESVQIGGRTLVRDRDYYVDYASGTVFLKVPYRDGESVQVDYRYDEATGTSGVFGIGGAKNGISGMKFRLSPGTSVTVGMGVTERMGDGTVVTSNVYGVSNSFGLGKGKLTGVAMFGDRRVENSRDMFGLQMPGTSVEEGKGKAIVQDLEAHALGGTVSLSYQEADDRFSGFQSLRESGLDDARVSQLQREQGLKRSSMSVQGIGGGAARVSASMRQVGDDQGSVTWRSYGGTLLGAEVKYEAHKVDPGFSRFQSLAEGDRDQLAKERGLDRQSLSLTRALPGGGLNFSMTKIEDLASSGLYRRSASLEVPWLKARFADQHVQQGFARIGDLREADREQLGREVGLSRQSEGFELTPGKRIRLAYDGNEVRTDAGDLVAQDAKVELGGLTFEHGRREVAPGFAHLGALTGDEVRAHVARGVQMLDAAATPRNEDFHSWGAWAGLSRSFARFGLDLGRGARIDADKLDIDGAEDGLDVGRFKFSSPKLNLSYREQTTGEAFSEAGRLMTSERAQLGTVLGFSQTDFAGDWTLGAGKRVEYARTRMGDLVGGASRESFGLSAFGLDVKHVRRSVDSTFTAIHQTADPERDYLARLLGFDESATAGKFQVTRDIALQGDATRSENLATGETRSQSNALARWSLDRNTRISAARGDYKVETPTGAQLDQRTQALSVFRDFGRFGKVTLTEEKREFDGLGDTLPDSVRQGVAFETAIDKTTSVRTEHARTRFESGEQETLTSNTVSKALSDRVGVSVSDTRIVRDGDLPDESHRDYGFWVDFGRSIRLNWKAKRDMVGETTGTLEQQVSVSPGEFQGINVASAAYQRNGWDDQRDRHVGNVNVSNAKPLDWGWLKDVRFHYNVDSERDHGLWQRERRSMGIGGRLGGFAFGYDYKLQTLLTGDRAIDRQFSATTDVSGKSWLRADVKYNLRTLPNDAQVMVRNYAITLGPVRGWSLSHSVLANPLQADGNALLGDFAQPTRSNKWLLVHDQSASTKIRASWEEFLNEQTGLEVVAARVGATLFADNPSPLHLEYVLAQTNEQGEKRRSHGFNIRFDQRPGKNQSLSFAFGNTNWELARPGDQKHQNWTLRLDYSSRF